MSALCGLGPCSVARRSSFFDPVEEERRKQRYYMVIPREWGERTGEGQRDLTSPAFPSPPVQSEQVAILHGVVLEPQCQVERITCSKGLGYV